MLRATATAKRKRKLKLKEFAIWPEDDANILGNDKKEYEAVELQLGKIEFSYSEHEHAYKVGNVFLPRRVFENQDLLPLQSIEVRIPNTEIGKDDRTIVINMVINQSCITLLRRVYDYCTSFDGHDDMLYDPTNIVVDSTPPNFNDHNVLPIYANVPRTTQNITIFKMATGGWMTNAISSRIFTNSTPVTEQESLIRSLAGLDVVKHMNAKDKSLKIVDCNNKRVINGEVEFKRVHNVTATFTWDATCLNVKAVVSGTKIMVKVAHDNKGVLRMSRTYSGDFTVYVPRGCVIYVWQNGTQSNVVRPRVCIDGFIDSTVAINTPEADNAEVEQMKATNRTLYNLVYETVRNSTDYSGVSELDLTEDKDLAFRRDVDKAIRFQAYVMTGDAATVINSWQFMPDEARATYRQLLFELAETLQQSHPGDSAYNRFRLKLLLPDLEFFNPSFWTSGCETAGNLRKDLESPSAKASGLATAGKYRVLNVRAMLTCPNIRQSQVNEYRQPLMFVKYYRDQFMLKSPIDGDFVAFYTHFNGINDGMRLLGKKLYYSLLADAANHVNIQIDRAMFSLIGADGYDLFGIAASQRDSKHVPTYDVLVKHISEAKPSLKESDGPRGRFQLLLANKVDLEFACSNNGGASIEDNIEFIQQVAGDLLSPHHTASLEELTALSPADTRFPALRLANGPLENTLDPTLLCLDYSNEMRRYTYASLAGELGLRMSSESRQSYVHVDLRNLAISATVRSRVWRSISTALNQRNSNVPFRVSVRGVWAHDNDRLVETRHRDGVSPSSTWDAEFYKFFLPLLQNCKHRLAVFVLPTGVPTHQFLTVFQLEEITGRRGCEVDSANWGTTPTRFFTLSQTFVDSNPILVSPDEEGALSNFTSFVHTAMDSVLIAANYRKLASGHYINEDGTVAVGISRDRESEWWKTSCYANGIACDIEMQKLINQNIDGDIFVKDVLYRNKEELTVAKSGGMCVALAFFHTFVLYDSSQRYVTADHYCPGPGDPQSEQERARRTISHVNSIVDAVHRHGDLGRIQETAWKTARVTFEIPDKYTYRECEKLVDWLGSFGVSNILHLVLLMNIVGVDQVVRAQTVHETASDLVWGLFSHVALRTKTRDGNVIRQTHCLEKYVDNVGISMEPAILAGEVKQLQRVLDILELTSFCHLTMTPKSVEINNRIPGHPKCESKFTGTFLHFFARSIEHFDNDDTRHVNMIMQFASQLMTASDIRHYGFGFRLRYDDLPRKLTYDPVWSRDGDAINLFSFDHSAILKYKTATAILIAPVVTEIPDSALQGFENLHDIGISTSVTSIGASAFQGCSALDRVIIPPSVKSVGRDAFKGCTKLEVVTVESSIDSIGQFAFKGCINLRKVVFEATSYQPRIECIEPCTFEDCKALTYITIPNSVHTIKSSAFSGCTTLTGIALPSGLRTIEMHAFEYCSNLHIFTIPEQTSTIGVRAFQKCAKLTRVTIPSSVTRIEESAFADCTSLRFVNVEPRLCQTTIEKLVFKNCRNLNMVVLPESLTSVQNEIFKNCPSLTHCTIEETRKLVSTDGPVQTFNGGNPVDLGLPADCRLRAPDYVVELLTGSFDSFNSVDDLKREERYNNYTTAEMIGFDHFGIPLVPEVPKVRINSSDLFNSSDEDTDSASEVLTEDEDAAYARKKAIWIECLKGDGLLEEQWNGVPEDLKQDDDVIRTVIKRAFESDVYIPPDRAERSTFVVTILFGASDKFIRDIFKDTSSSLSLFGTDYDDDSKSDDDKGGPASAPQDSRGDDKGGPASALQDSRGDDKDGPASAPQDGRDDDREGSFSDYDYYDSEEDPFALVDSDDEPVRDGDDDDSE